MQQQHTITSKEIDSWLLSDDGRKLYSTDAVIDAYLKGKQKGKADALDEHQKALQDTFALNFAKSGSDTKELFKFLADLGINPVSAHLRLNSISSFEIVVLLNEDDFLGEKMDAVYEWCRQFQNSVVGNSYRICFNFIDYSETFDFNQLNSDGFSAKYRPKK